MDPVTLIVTALVAGATAAAKETAGNVIKDAYKGLKALIQKRFAGKPEAEIALEKHEQKPQVWGEPLKDALTEAGATKDDAILKAAQELLQKADPEGAARNEYNVQFHDQAIGTHVGQGGTINVTIPHKEYEKD